MAKQILLHNDRNQDFTHLNHMFAIANISFVEISNVNDFANFYDTEKFFNIFITSSTDDKALGVIKNNFSPLYVILYSDIPLKNILENENLFYCFDGIIPDPLTELNTFLLSNLLISLQKYQLFYMDFDAMAKTVTPEKYLIRNNMDKENALKLYENKLIQAKVDGFQINYVLEAFGELLNNAIVADPNKQKNFFIQSANDPSLPFPAPLEIKWIIRDDYLITNVSDKYGLLRKNHLFVTMAENFLRQNKSMFSLLKKSDDTQIGFYKVLKAVSNIVINVVPHKRTDVFFLLHRKQSKKDLRKNPATIVYNMFS